MILYVAIILSLISSYVAGEIARSRGLDVTFWRWTGALFGPFAFAVLFVPQRVPQTVRRNQRR